MGYTHYWAQQRAYTQAEWSQITATIKAIIAASDVPVAREYDRPDDPVEFTDSILFNGVGDDGHETFVFTREVAPEPEYRKGEGDFQFCKTARKPYDEIVVACLIAASELGVITWSSDGEGEPDYLTDGNALLREVKAMECPGCGEIALVQGDTVETVDTHDQPSTFTEYTCSECGHYCTM